MLTRLGVRKFERISEVHAMNKANETSQTQNGQELAYSPANPAHARAWELARQQGVKPILNIEELRGDFWPEDESTDEFLEWLGAIRQEEEGARGIPE
jgi:hypothetical protein